MSKNDKIERRTIKSNIELREIVNGDKKATQIIGLAIPFNSQSLPIETDDDGKESPSTFIEEIDPAAFDKSIQDANADIVMLFAHDWDKPIARQSAKNFKLSKADDGIHYEATPADTTRARDLIEDIKAGNIQGNSFGFICVRDNWFKDDAGTTHRRVLDAVLLEVSPVVNPAYPDTQIAQRSLKTFTAAAQKQDATTLRERRIRLLRVKSKINKNTKIL